MKYPHWLSNPIPALILTALWLLLNNSIAPGQILLGLVLGFAISQLCQPFLIQVPRLKSPYKLCLLVVRVFCDVVVANLNVARLVLGPEKNLHPGFVEVPMQIEDEFVLATLACIISLTPGTVSAGLSQDHKRLLLHALDISRPDQLIAEVKNRYEAPLLEIFQCSTT